MVIIESVILKPRLRSGSEIKTIAFVARNSGINDHDKMFLRKDTGLAVIPDLRIVDKNTEFLLDWGFIDVNSIALVVFADHIKNMRVRIFFDANPMKTIFHSDMTQFRIVLHGNDRLVVIISLDNDLFGFFTIAHDFYILWNSDVFLICSILDPDFRSALRVFQGF